MNYQAIYDNLVKQAQSNSASGYVEKHHIIPRSMGGTNDASNIVKLTARQHFVAHWLLFKIYKNPSMAKAFRLMLDASQRPKSRSYEIAKSIYAQSMRGENNVAKRPDVRQKIKDNAYSVFAGKKRPEHSILMKQKGTFVGKNNPFYGTGASQIGAKNHMARSVIGQHNNCVSADWDTITDAAKEIGVSLQAVFQAIKKNTKSKGWSLSYGN